MLTRPWLNPNKTVEMIDETHKYINMRCLAQEKVTGCNLSPVNTGIVTLEYIGAIREENKCMDGHHGHHQLQRPQIRSEQCPPQACPVGIGHDGCINC